MSWNPFNVIMVHNHANVDSLINEDKFDHSEVYEIIMANYLLEFLNSNNTVYIFQFGLCKHVSTSHAIILLVEKINKAISLDKYMIGVFLDFQKAYDTVNHSII